MTVPVQTPVATHTGNGVTTAFPFGFRLLAQADISVTVDGLVKTLGVDYTVSGVDVEAGGTVTFVTAPIALSEVALVRQVALNRLTDYQYSGDFQSREVNRDFDRLVMMLQDSGIALANAVRFPAGDSANGLLPSASNRALKGLAFDALGNPVVTAGAGNADVLAAALLSTTPSTGGALVGFNAANTYPAGSVGAALKSVAALPADIASTTDAAKGATLVGYKANATGAVGRTLASKMLEMLSVKDFGCVGNGVTNDSANFQIAVNAAKAAGVMLYVPAGKYLISNINLEGVALIGAGPLERDPTIDSGTFIYVTDTVNPCFNVVGAVVIEGINFYYPNQVTSGTPTAYPPTIAGSISQTLTHLNVRYCQAINSYDFLRVGDVAKTTAHGRIWLQGCVIYSIRNDLELHYILDVILISDCMFTYGAFDAIAIGQTLKNWSAKNGSNFVLDRVDGLSVSNSILFGKLRGFYVITALTDLLKVTNSLFDACSSPLVVDSGGSLLDSIFTGCNFYCYAVGDNTYVANPILLAGAGANGASLTFAGCDFINSTGGWIDISGSVARSLRVTGCNFGAVGQAVGAAGAYASLSVNDADVAIVVSGCGFDGGAYAGSVGVSLTNVGEALLSGNQFRTCSVPVAVTAVTTQVALVGNTSSNTGGGSSVSITSGAKPKTLLGMNKFDKPTPQTVGSPKFLARLAATTTVNSGTDTTIAFATEIIDSSEGYNAGVSVFTAPIAGVYRLACRLTHDNTIVATDRWLIKIKTTARDYPMLYRAPAADVLTVQHEALVEMTAGSTAFVTVARSNGAGNFVTQADATMTEFSGSFVG